MSQEFRPTWLYVKRCTHCDLLYVGKTLRKDVDSYKGSGKYWIRHLQQHDVEKPQTLSKKLYHDRKSLKSAAVKFSAKHDVVNARHPDGRRVWANLIPENGINGGRTELSIVEKMVHSANAVEMWKRPGMREKLRKAMKGNGKGVPKSEEHRRNIGLAQKGKRLRPEHVKKMLNYRKSVEGQEVWHNINKGKKWYNDGVRGYMLYPDDPRTKRLQRGQMPATESRRESSRQGALRRWSNYRKEIQQ